MPAVNTQLVDGVVSAVSGLAFVLDGQSLPVPVTKSKLPKAESPDLDSLPRIWVSPAEKPTRDEPYDTTPPYGRRWREYLVEVLFIGAGNGDPITDLDSYMDLRQAVSRAFGEAVSLPSVVELVTTNCEPDPPYLREGFLLNYDCSGISVRFGCVEPAH